MKNYSDRLGFLTALAVMLVGADAHAAERQITDVELESNKHQLELKLSATDSQSKASFYTVRNGNTIEANLLDTNLDLPQGNSFKQVNPIPGVSAVEINQIDRQHTQVVVSAEPDVEIEHLLEQQGEDLILSLDRITKAKSFQREVEQFGQKAAKKIEQTYKTALGQKRTKDDKKTVASKDNSNDVLIPNPEIAIEDNRVEEIKERVFRAQDEPGDDPVPATLPRAVAPPVGDMAVSNVSTMPDMVDLSSAAIVPRLVLRDAPIREVLSLLARSANLNVVYAGGDAEESIDGEETGPTISLDLENEPVQEVFNSVLLISGLDANRRGNIIYVGEQLPAQARNLVSRTIRLNQVGADNAALYLASLGAEGKILKPVLEDSIDPETGRIVQRVEVGSELSALDTDEDETGTKALLLRGLQVSTDGRLNSITLVGEPRKVETATNFLTQLDARRRQVAVNVKVIDVNLLNQDVFNSSFSFGVNDSFFVQDNGSASLRFGETAPPTSAEFNSATGRVSNPPTIVNPFADADTFLDLDLANGFSVPDTIPGRVDDQGNVLRERGVGRFYDSFPAVSENPFFTGITDITKATNDAISRDPETGRITFTQGQDGTADSALPSFLQFPDKFLALLEARVTSGNAKILTDPTLMVQEGQQATVKLAQNIIESVQTSIDGETGSRTITPVIAEAGVVLTVNVEQIDDNGFVSMSVSPTVSSIGATQEFDSGDGAVNLLNLLSKRELSSGLVRLRDGQTLILSGIIQDQERSTVSKVPILGDIPLLGALFRSTDKASERAEVIVLLTPEIVEEDAGLANNFMPGKESREILQREGVDAMGN